MCLASLTGGTLNCKYHKIGESGDAAVSDWLQGPGSTTETNIDRLRKRLASMSEAELVVFGETVRDLVCPRMVSAFENPFEAQLEMARAEWRRRHPGRRKST